MRQRLAILKRLRKRRLMNTAIENYGRGIFPSALASAEGKIKGVTIRDRCGKAQQASNGT
jgi:hypothetical protein